MKNFSRFITLTLAAVALLGGCGKSNDPDTPQKPDEPDQPSAPVYKVGDYYEKGFVKGIVISVDEKGEHGMVVSLNETEAVWSYSYEEAMGSQPGTGKYNTECIYKMKDWRNQYPAFDWCSRKNVGSLKDWFIPSMNELAHLYKAYTGHEANDTEQGTGSIKSKADDSSSKAWFNKCLTDKKGTALTDGIYWSSNETGPSIVYAFDMQSGTSVTDPDKLDKKQTHRVRAFAEF